MFIALVIAVILILLGLALFFLLRDALLSNLEDTARNRALGAAETIGSGEYLDEDDVEQLTLEGTFVIVRDGDGRVLDQTENLPADSGDGDPVWQKALDSGEAVSGTAELSREAPA